MGAQGNFRLLLGNLQTIYFDDVAEEYQRTFIMTCEDRYKNF